MDEDISAINTSTRNEKIKIFFVNNRKRILSLLSILIILIVSYFVYEDIKKKIKKKLLTNSTIIK